MLLLRILLLTFCILNSASLFGQSYFPTASDSMSWNVCETVYGVTTGYVNKSTSRFNIVRDTQMCGATYSVVDFYENETAYLRYDSAKVFIKPTNDCSVKDYLMYDFGLNIGDSVYCGYELFFSQGGLDTTKFWVESIDSVNGKKRLKLKYFLSSWDETYTHTIFWIEDFGADLHPFHALFPLTNQYCECDFDTLCQYKFLDLPDSNKCFCDTTLYRTSIDDIAQSKIETFPNPVENTWTINIAQNASLNLFSLDGQIVLEKDIFQGANSIDMNELQQGVYLYQVFEENALGIIYSGKLIKQ